MDQKKNDSSLFTITPIAVVWLGFLLFMFVVLILSHLQDLKKEEHKFLLEKARIESAKEK